MSDESALLHCGNTAGKTEKQYYCSVYVYAAATDDNDGERSETIITDFERPSSLRLRHSRILNRQ